MKNKLNINLFSEENNSENKNDQGVKKPNIVEEPNASSSHPKTNQSNNENKKDDLEQYKQDNFKPTPKSSRDEAIRRKKRGKIAIISTIVLLLFGGLIFWIVSSNWSAPVRNVEKIENNTIYLSNGGSYNFDGKDDPSVSATWGATTHQIKFTLNGGMFKGESFIAWLDSNDQLSITAKEGQSLVFKISDASVVSGTNTTQLAKSLSSAAKGAYVESSGPNFLMIILNLLPTILIIIMIVYFFKMMRAQSSGEGAGGIFGIGKSQAKLANSTVKFTDVAGIKEEKNELMEVVDYLRNPGKYAAMGARTPKGIILYGPPGTGKTLLAKAVAGEAGVPFFESSGSAFEDMLVGVGAKRVRDLFSKAAKAAPAIIFIDEIDSVASKRGKNDIIGGGGGVADQTINQLLAEMDGFTTNSGVIVIAATNRLDVLDPAILRPGRFDRHIQINLPDIKERLEILKIHSRNKNISSSVNLEEIARRTPGFSGAQLENVINEATLLAVRDNKNTISLKHLDEAIDRVIAGPAKHTRVITKEEKKQIAYHEAGHALVGLHTPGSDVVQKITIIPRGNAAGYTLSTPEKQELSIQKKRDLLAIIASTLGGRAAEELIYGKENVSTGASNDLYKVTNIVRAMVTQLGMSNLGMTQFVPSEGTTNPYAAKLYSDETALLIDKEIDKIISEQYKVAIEIIKKNKKELDLLVEALLILETITKEQIDYIHKHLKLPKEALDKKIN